MDIDISQVMAYEIKKEMAERYFGFRKLIEEDKEKLAAQIRRQSMTAEQRIVLDLARIYILLKEPRLIRHFLTLTGLEEELFYDEYLVTSPTIRARVFAGIQRRGLTKAGRFKNLLLDCYEQLVADVDGYREKFGELLETREFISEEIKLFYHKNDLGSMLGFLRQLDGDANTGLAGPVVARVGEDMATKLLVEAPEAIEHHLPVIPPLVAPTRIRGELKKLAEVALAGHPAGFVITG